MIGMSMLYYISDMRKTLWKKIETYMILYYIEKEIKITF